MDLLFRVYTFNSGGRVIEYARYLKKLLVDLLQCVNALFKLDIVWRKLGLGRWSN